MQFSKPFAEPTISPIRQLMGYATRLGTISFAGGHPDVRLFDVDALRTASERVNADLRAHLQYGDTAGEGALLSALATLSARRGIAALADQNMVVTSGSQQAMTLVAKVMLGEGDRVVVESPCFPSTLQAVQQTGATLLPVASGPNGIDLDALETVLQNEQPKMICVVATFSNPTGACMPLEHRHRLLALAEKYRVLVVEDDPYSDLRYSNATIPPIAACASAAQREWIVYLSSLSKTVAPALRIGWMVAPAELRRRCVSAKQADDLSTSPWGQAIATAYLSTDTYDCGIARLIDAYTARRDAMCESLSRLCSATIEFSRPDGGMFVWARLKGGRDARALIEHAIDREVVFVPGSGFYPDPDMADPSTLRLSFVCVDTAQIVEGIERLAAAIARLDRASLVTAWSSQANAAQSS